MQDCKGNTINVGDYVVFVRRKTSTASLETGHVTKIFTDKYGESECSVGRQTHISSSRILKITE